MLSSSAQFTAAAAPHDPRVHPVGSAWSVMPVRQADADDADDATHHGNHGGVSRWTMQPEPVTILKPMCRINMTPEGDPQVALAASHSSSAGSTEPSVPSVARSSAERPLDFGAGSLSPGSTL
jgi:hypothetical protein